MLVVLLVEDVLTGLVGVAPGLLLLLVLVLQPEPLDGLAVLLVRGLLADQEVGGRLARLPRQVVVVVEVLRRVRHGLLDQVGEPDVLQEVLPHRYRY